MAANCALAAAQPQVALDRAQAAYRLFRSQQSAWWEAHAGLVLVRARYAAGQVSAQLLNAADRAACGLTALGSAEATQAHLVAGRVALDLGRGLTPIVTSSLPRAAGRAGLAPRASGWLSEALRAEAAADPRRLLAACRRGLELLDELQLTLGASELRAQATAPGPNWLSWRSVRLRGPAPALLPWSERWRATALAVPPVRPRPTGNWPPLGAARDAASRLAQAQARGRPAAALQRQRRARRGGPGPGMRAPGAGGVADGPACRPGRTCWTSWTDPTGRRSSASTPSCTSWCCGDGRVRHVTAGQADQAIRVTELARSGLRRLAHSCPSPDGVQGAGDNAGPGDRRGPRGQRGPRTRAPGRDRPPAGAGASR